MITAQRIYFRDDFSSRSTGIYLTRYEDNKKFIAKITWEEVDASIDWPEASLRLHPEDLAEVFSDIKSTRHIQHILKDEKSELGAKDEHINSLKNYIERNFNIIDTLIKVEEIRGKSEMFL